MNKKLKFISSLFVIVFLTTAQSNANEDVYETYKKPVPRQSVTEDLKEEAVNDLNALSEIRYLKLKTNSPYEIALANEDGTYIYVESANDFDEAIKITENMKNLKTNQIPVVINEDGIIVHATQGIGRIVRIFNGTASSTSQGTFNVYTSSSLSNAHTYMNHAYIDDVVLLSNTSRYAKFEGAGYTGYMKQTEGGVGNIMIVPTNQAYGLSHYKVNSKGELIHYISSNITSYNPNYTSRVIGLAPSSLKQNVKYYSYDGNYFYTNINTLISDAKSSTHRNAINTSSPYYAYNMYLPIRSKTTYTASELNRYLSANTPRNSVLRGTGQNFINAQEKYGVNATFLIGVAMNESGRGTSSMAREKNNIFGANAKDGYTSGAYKFSSVAACIDWAADNLFSEGYANPNNWKYNGGALGNKAFGMNVKYASDPFWSEKALDSIYEIDDYLGGAGLKDYNKYQLGLMTRQSYVHTSSGSSLYTISPKTGVSYPTIIQGTSGSKYKIQPEISRYNFDGGRYSWSTYGYTSKNNVKLINTTQSDSLFMDVSKYYWAHDDIKYLVDKGIVSSSQVYFRPESDITRAEFVAMINRAMGYTKINGEHYRDVNASHWYYKDVCLALTAGYLSKEEKNFRPNDPISRQEAAAIISSVTNSKDTNINKIKRYKDYNDMSYWAWSSIEGVVEKGYMGVGVDRFYPKDRLTRAESSAIIARVVRSK